VVYTQNVMRKCLEEKESRCLNKVGAFFVYCHLVPQYLFTIEKIRTKIK